MTLPEFSRWFLSQPIGQLRPPYVPVRNIVFSNDGLEYVILGVVLYRQAPFQVEQFIGPSSEAGSFFPDHRHPNVDSIEVYQTGEIGFSINGRRLLSDEQMAALSPDGSQAVSGSVHLIRSRDWHGGQIGPMGFSFLSIQKWTDGVEPSSVTLNWIGPPPVSVT